MGDEDIFGTATTRLRGALEIVNGDEWMRGRGGLRCLWEIDEKVRREAMDEVVLQCRRESEIESMGREFVRLKVLGREGNEGRVIRMLRRRSEECRAVRQRMRKMKN